MTSPQVPLVSSKKAHKALVRLGFEDSHCNGSHQTMVRYHDDGPPDILILVLGKKELVRFTLRNALAQGNVTVEEFIAKL